MRKAALVFFIIASLWGCQKSPSLDAKQGGAEPLQKITVAYTLQPQSTLVHVALAKGYFGEEGLAVESIIHTFGKAALQSPTSKPAA